MLKASCGQMRLRTEHKKARKIWIMKSLKSMKYNWNIINLPSIQKPHTEKFSNIFLKLFQLTESQKFTGEIDFPI